MIKKILILSCAIALNCQTTLTMESQQEWNQRIATMETENIYNKILSCLRESNKTLDEISFQNAYKMANALHSKKYDQILELLEDELFFDLTLFEVEFEDEIQKALGTLLNNKKDNNNNKEKAVKKEIKTDDTHKNFFDLICNSDKNELLNENEFLTHFFEKQGIDENEDVNGKKNIIAFFKELKERTGRQTFIHLNDAFNMFDKQEARDRIIESALSGCENLMLLTQYVLSVKNIFKHNELESSSSFQQFLSLFLKQNRDYHKIAIFSKEKTKNLSSDEKKKIANSNKMIGTEKNVPLTKMNEIIGLMSSLSAKQDTKEFQIGLLYWQQAFSFLMVLNQENNLVFGEYKKYVQYFFRSFFEAQWNHRGDEKAFLNNGYKAFLVLFGFLTGDLDKSDLIMQYDLHEKIIKKNKKK